MLTVSDISFVLFSKRNYQREGKARVGTPTGFFSADEGCFPMADKRALKLIGIIFAALTLVVISTAAAVVAGHAASRVNGEYLKLVDLRD
ncbi:hypothetical protein CP49_26815 [Bradyrhizobium valentinum]|uniref:Uncharacterized protein n=1 Tax=Bradyrhizobium valentinum TaxID=1518501 RepID=A0A0R3LFE1_9BRAD|nr:hypothetical protein CP49_26815 [Bradyrhizobium valentinum]